MIAPLDPPIVQEFAEGLDRGEEFALLNGESLDAELDRSAVTQPHQRLHQSVGILATRKADSHTVAFANHFESRHRFRNALPNLLFESHYSIIVTSARWVACQVLLDVERGASSDVALDRRARGLDPRDAGLATEIAAGVLRRKSQLDWYIDQKTRPGVDIEVRVALEIGLYQRLHLTRVPAHAAVSESVEMVRALRKASAAGLVNAVLRRLPLRILWPTRALELAMPEWLLARWDAHFGTEAATAVARAALKPPCAFVRWHEPAEGLEATDVPGCWRVNVDVPDGARRMDIGSQAVALLLGVQAGEQVLDLCAAPGNKTAVLLEPGARVVACDSNPKRLRGLLADCPRVGLDATAALPFGRVFDRILVDTPCSGTGTLARNPEIKWRLRPEDIERQARRQRSILGHALECLKPGGSLVYSTCSLEPEENAQVVEPFAAGRVLRTMERLPGRDPGDGFWAAMLS